MMMTCYYYLTEEIYSIEALYPQSRKRQLFREVISGRAVFEIVVGYCPQLRMQYLRRFSTHKYFNSFPKFPTWCDNKYISLLYLLFAHTHVFIVFMLISIFPAER